MAAGLVLAPLDATPADEAGKVLGMPGGAFEEMGDRALDYLLGGDRQPGPRRAAIPSV